eukprot:scaffold31586_cov67-Skeletonema_dohrnii-CCMP3373.AAC.1
MEARSRRRNAPSSANGTNGHIGNGIYDVASGGGDSDSRSTARMERKAKRKHRVANARTRRRAGGGRNNNNTAAIGDGEARGMRGLVKKTKEKLKKFRDKHRRGATLAEEE